MENLITPAKNKHLNNNTGILGSNWLRTTDSPHFYTLSILVCGLGWKGFSGSCYRYFGSETQKYTWQEAHQDCLKHRSHLLSIHSVEEHRFVQTIIPTYDSFSKFFPWIGARYITSNSNKLQPKLSSSKSKLNAIKMVGRWEWEDGSNFDYWDEHYSPSGPDLSGRCIAINNWAVGLWVDTECDTGHSYVCKKKLFI